MQVCKVGRLGIGAVFLFVIVGPTVQTAGNNNLLGGWGTIPCANDRGLQATKWLK